MPNFVGLMDKIGVRYLELTAGESKRTLTPFSEPTPQKEAIELERLQAIHRAFKDLIKKRRPNQSALWNDIAEKSSRMKATSPTRAMSAVYEKHALSINEYVDTFDCDAQQAGVLFVIPGHCMGVDLFDHPTTLHRLFPKLVRSYALDAFEASVTAPQTGDLADTAKKIPEKNNRLTKFCAARNWNGRRGSDRRSIIIRRRALGAGPICPHVRFRPGWTTKKR
jgi:hypothetical protein